VFLPRGATLVRRGTSMKLICRGIEFIPGFPCFHTAPQAVNTGGVHSVPSGEMKAQHLASFCPF